MLTLIFYAISIIMFVVGLIAIIEQVENIAITAGVIGLVMLIAGKINTYNTHIADMKSNQYNYQIQYNNTTYYTNDYILSNGGIEFEAEEGHFIFPVEGQELKIKKTKKGDQ